MISYSDVSSEFRMERTLVNASVALRHRLPTSHMSATRLPVVGFHEKSPESFNLPGSIGETVLCQIVSGEDAKL